MNAANFAFNALNQVAQSVERRRPSINITPSVLDFANQNARKIDALGRVGSALERAAYFGGASVAMLSPEDFAVLKAFVEFADGEFALAGVALRDSAVDQPFSRDESHHRDQERL